MIQHTRGAVVQFAREMRTTMPRQVSWSSEFATAAPATPMVKMTRLFARMTKNLSVVTAASY
jgi:hypothetical protein